MKLSENELARATTATLSNATKYCDPLNAAMVRFKINTPRRVAGFLATVAVESWNLTKVEEGLYYRDAARLAKLFKRAFESEADAAPYARNPKGLSELLYQGFHGRGLIQLTWRKNYELAGADLGFDYAEQPTLLLQPQHAALTAAWYWTFAGCNEAIDCGDMEDATRRVNGPAKLHLKERVLMYASNLEWMGVA